MPPESSGNCGYAFNMNNGDTQSGWIIDFGATDHITYDPTDLACDIDILTKEIISRGTKKGDLYFVDDVTIDHKQHQICSCYIRASTVRFSAPTKGYRCYHLPSGRMYTTMDVTFSESEMYYSSAFSNPPLQGVTLHDEQVWTMAASIDLPLPLLAEPAVATLPSQPTEAISLPTKPAAGMAVLSLPMAPVLPLANVPNYQLPFRHNRGKPPNEYSPETTKDSKYPIANYEALFDDRWTKAMEEEMDALQKNQTWDLVPLPRGKKIVGCRWGYTLTYGVDYRDTFAPVAKINTVEQFRSYTFLETSNGPDIAYAVSVVSQFMHSPSDTHMGAVERILRYLNSSPRNITDRLSTSGYFTFVGGNLVTWRSKKQKVVALSSAEAEYRGMEKGVCELLWLRRLLTELGCPSMLASNFFCDNKAAIDISYNPIQHDRTKHVEVDRYFIKEKLDGNIIQFPFVKSEDQLADILTKIVASQAFYNSLVKLGMNNIYTPT
ncbi:hypothetical protein D8674_027243 [Pyrus ussuriensis x Pyrus communis]|uniref:Retroviral polymerase SH3-like domain-containing protein n=1 Tax=Pyrus ussuriensis x Pyrus communis TaxID=2448454 RepID=A0A5N5IAI0_9ROSA|nr:hypothetical protein D8674_027243 [Pyrus ussuriensis x Pyrus communis]